MQIFEVEAVSVLPLEHQQSLSLRKQVEISDEREPGEFSDLGELLEDVVHVLGHLRPKVDVWSRHDLSQRLAQFDLLDQAVEVQVQSVFEPHVWVVQQRVLPVVWFLSQVGLVELLDCSALSSETFEDVHSGFAVHETEAAEEVQRPIVPLVWGELFGAHVPCIVEIEAFAVDSLERILNLLDLLRSLVGNYDDQPLEDAAVQVAGALRSSPSCVGDAALSSTSAV